MTQQNDITQPVLTDDELMALLPGAVRLPPGWIDTARAIQSALLSKLRAEGVPVAHWIPSAKTFAATTTPPGKAWEPLYAAPVASAPADERANEKCKRCGGPGWYTSHTTGYPESIPCSACNPQGVSVGRLEKDPFLAAQFWRKPADADADAYKGAREDLAIWKRRALEAERDLRAERETSSRLVAELNTESGPMRMGDPAALASAPVAMSETERHAITGLIAVARAAFNVADNAEDDGDQIRVGRADADTLSTALDALDELPDDQPGYSMGPSNRAEWALRRLLSEASAPVADERECGNADCGWRGTTERMCGSVGPLCPECGETTEASAPVAGEAQGWSGWACQYPDKLPRLYGAREIAELNCDSENGDRLLILSENAAPQASEAVRDALAVWYGSMPESNGKSNWTAILHRKSDKPFDGPHITIERSEYPDRVRYEADRVRYIIGELDKEPFVLDYDADKCDAQPQAYKDGCTCPSGDGSLRHPCPMHPQADKDGGQQGYVNTPATDVDIDRQQRAGDVALPPLGKSPGCGPYYTHKEIKDYARNAVLTDRQRRADDSALWRALAAASNYIDTLGGDSKSYRAALSATQTEQGEREDG